MAVVDDSKKDVDALEGTRVDLGDDLLEKTAMIPGLPPKQAIVDAPINLPIGPDQVEDQLESARILANEGLIEDAKKILHQVLLVDPHHVTARQRLEEIHEEELKHLFSEVPTRKRRPTRQKDATEETFDSEDIMRRLDRDLRLGVIDEESGHLPLAAELSFFQDAAAMERFSSHLDRQLTEANAHDRIDIGIGFLEMGLYELALRQFKIASRDPVFELSAAGLTAQALIASGRAFDAAMALEPIVSDTELEPGERIHFLYLMARAHERLNHREAALQWLQKVVEIDGNYRDAGDRIRRHR